MQGKRGPGWRPECASARDGCRRPRAGIPLESDDASARRIEPVAERDDARAPVAPLERPLRLAPDLAAHALAVAIADEEGREHRGARAVALHREARHRVADLAHWRIFSRAVSRLERSRSSSSTSG